jgi:hypothetical protein
MSKPVVTVKNNASRDISVEGDPNWDDQQLLINDQVITRAYTLTKGATITVSVNWEDPGDELMIGVIFSAIGGDGSYQLSVGQEPETGNLGVTDGDPGDGELDIKYTLSDQTPWSMKMDFTDASK